MSASLTPAGLVGNGYQVDTFGDSGHRVYNIGNKRGTGTYTLFTRGASNAQSTGEVIIHGIYSTPSASRITRYIISGNLSIAQVFNTNTSAVPIPSLTWNGNALEVSSSNGSLYYGVEVILHGVGNDWNHTWGNFPGMS